jgi:hypothetical protein
MQLASKMSHVIYPETAKTPNTYLHFWKPS